MKALIAILIITLISSACTTVDVPERPSRVEEVTLEDGRVVLQYIPGYSIEDFMGEFNRPSN